VNECYPLSSARRTKTLSFFIIAFVHPRVVATSVVIAAGSMPCPTTKATGLGPKSTTLMVPLTP
jgi:hypothetical protein